MEPNSPLQAPVLPPTFDTNVGGWFPNPSEKYAQVKLGSNLSNLLKNIPLFQG